MPEDDRIAGMDEEGLRRTIGELLASNRGTQANFDEIRQQFPIQPSSLADSIPDWSELEEGGLEPPGGEEGESFAEQLGVGAGASLFTGEGTVEWEGGQEGTGITFITHGVGSAPAQIFLTMFNLGIGGLLPQQVVVAVREITATKFKVEGWTTNGSKPAAGVKRSFFWLAVP